MKKELLSFKRLNVIPQGYVQNGFLEYNVDTDSGLITYNYELNVKVWFIPYQVAGTGTTKVAPSELLSENVKPGQMIKIGPVTGVVESIADGKAHCSLTIIDGVDSINEAGEVILSVAGKYIDVISVNEAGTAKGFAITIQAE